MLKVSVIVRYVISRALILLFTSQLLTFSTSLPQSLPTLRLVQVLYRHGDRSPLHVFPSDIYKDYWTEGLGQLTKLGMEQQYNLGQFFRQQYDGFLSENYNLSEVYIRSSDVDRTLMSAACNLAGLYPPEAAQLWNPRLLWQPIPVHTIAKDDDYLLGSHACSKLDKLVKKTYNSSEVERINDRYRDLFEVMTEKAQKNITTIIDAFKVYDTFVIQKIHNLTVPSWGEQVISRLEKIRFMKVVWKLYTREMIRLKTGELLKEMFANMKSKMAGTENRKMFIFSGHDTNVAGMLRALNVFNNATPPYSSAVVFELHQMFASDYRVQISFRNQSNSPPFVLTVPGCSDLCPFHQLTKLMSDVIAGDIQQECELTAAELHDETSLIGFKPPKLTAYSLGFIYAMLILSVMLQ